MQYWFSGMLIIEQKRKSLTQYHSTFLKNLNHFSAKLNDCTLRFLDVIIIALLTHLTKEGHDQNDRGLSTFSELQVPIV